MSPNQVAKSFLGVKELPGNKFKDDPNIAGDLGELIKKAGQKDGEAWCAYFVEAVLCKAYPAREAQFRKLCDASAVKTLSNFRAAGFSILREPVIGSVAVWQTYKGGVAHWTGHIGIVSDVISKFAFHCIEGNTNNDGGREGHSVLQKYRKVRTVKDGLSLIGFILI